jgi:cephalosporin hydroxylase
MEMQQIINIVENIGSDSNIIFGGKWEGGKNILQIPDEISPCIHAILNSNVPLKNWMEIGAAAGGNTYLFNYFFNFENVVVLDDNQHPKHHLRAEILKDIKNVKEFVGDSHSKEAIDFVKNLQLTYDIMFIDGDHSYNGVKQDTDNFTPFLKNKGYVIYHDSHLLPSIAQLKNELLQNPSFTHIGTYISPTHIRPLGVSCFQKK